MILFNSMFCPPNPLGLQSHPRGSAWVLPQGSGKPCFQSPAEWPNPDSSGWRPLGLLKWRQRPESLKLRGKLWWSWSHLRGHPSLFLVNSACQVYGLYNLWSPPTFLHFVSFFFYSLQSRMAVFLLILSQLYCGFCWDGWLSPWVAPMISFSDACWDTPLVFFSEQTFSICATWGDWEFSKSQIWFIFA